MVTPLIVDAKKDGVLLETKDEFNPSWVINLPFIKKPGKPTFHHPDASKNPSGTITVNTVSENVYNPIDVQFDPGITPNTAQRIRAKFPSRQAVQEAAGHKIDFDAKNNENIISKINQLAIDVAYAMASPKAQERYDTRGKPLIAGYDNGVRNGPAWIWSSFEKCLSTNTDGKPQYTIDSTIMRTPTESGVQKIPLLPSKIGKGIDKLIGGKHFGTLLSPAEAMRHIYEDSLRPLPRNITQQDDDI